jgi:hypothetical protein
MLICFAAIKGIIHSEFLSKIQTVNQASYLHVLEILQQHIHWKRQNLWTEKTVCFMTMHLPTQPFWLSDFQPKRISVTEHPT